jgi:hypothetical protein
MYPPPHMTCILLQRGEGEGERTRSVYDMPTTLSFRVHVSYEEEDTCVL